MQNQVTNLYFVEHIDSIMEKVRAHMKEWNDAGWRLLSAEQTAHTPNGREYTLWWELP